MSLAQQAFDAHAPWLRSFGRRPTNPAAQTRWLQAVATVAAYRERWNVTDKDDPLDAPTQSHDAEQAQQLLTAANAIRTAARLGIAERGPRRTREQIGAEPTAISQQARDRPLSRHTIPTIKNGEQ